MAEVTDLVTIKWQDNTCTGEISSFDFVLDVACTARCKYEPSMLLTISLSYWQCIHTGLFASFCFFRPLFFILLGHHLFITFKITGTTLVTAHFAPVLCGFPEIYFVLQCHSLQNFLCAKACTKGRKQCWLVWEKGWRNNINWMNWQWQKLAPFESYRSMRL